MDKNPGADETDLPSESSKEQSIRCFSCSRGSTPPWLESPVLVTVTIALLKLHDRKQLGEERVYFAYSSGSLFIIKRNQKRNSNRAGTQTGQEPGHRS